MSQSESNRFFSRERKRFNKIVISTALLLGFLGLAIVPPIVNFETTARVATHFITGEKIDCAQNVLPSNLITPYDAIVIPGGNGAYDLLPNKAQKIRLLAGAVAYVNGESEIIILHDGKLPKGADPKTTTKYLQAYVRIISRHTMEIPEDNIIVDNTSINTASGMIELDKIDHRYGFRKHLLITNSYHGDRATLYGCNRNIAISWKEAEKLAAMVDPSQAIENAKKKPPPLSITLKEKGEILFGMYDPRGDSTTTLKRVSRTNPELGHYFPAILTATILSLKKIKKLKKEKRQK